MNRPEATVAVCKCKETHKIYGVRFEKVSNSHWKYTWAFPMKESTAKREVMTARLSTVISNLILIILAVRIAAQNTL